MKSDKKIILSFDLDNTLINNNEGIINSFKYTVNKFNLSGIERERIEKMIGDPLEEIFSKFSDIDPSILAFTFREYYEKKGIYQSQLLKGVKKRLVELKSQNFVLGIITSKKQEMAEKIVKYLKIREFFNYILGETDERKVLGKLDPKIKEILLERYPNHFIVVIGDHPKDVILSNNLKCPFIGVLTGHHSADQLKRLKNGTFLCLNGVKDLSLKVIYSVIE